MTTQKAVIYGGKGALGAALVSFFKARNWWVLSIDLYANEEANENVLLENTEIWSNQEQTVRGKVESLLADSKVDAIFCVAGGWAGGNSAAKDFIRNADLMWKQSVWSSAIAASLACQHLRAGGVLTLPGAQAALSGTPGMAGYGMAKAAVHQLTKSLAQPSSGMPEGAFVAATLPITLDTPQNRKFMPKADHSSWTPLETVIQMFYDWSQGDNRPPNGSLVQLITKEGHTDIILS